jgi:hypothetical protein
MKKVKSRRAAGKKGSKRARKEFEFHPFVRKALGVPPDQTDAEYLAEWKFKSRVVCKPCWELRYCPYGPLVEDFPLLPMTQGEMEAHNQGLREAIASGRRFDGRKLTPKQLVFAKRQLASYEPSDHPESIPEVITQMSCTAFGHICPVVWSAEPFTETTQSRRSGRYIPFKIKMRVVRRDNYTCQHCGVHLLDNEVEFDHRIPLARGGSSDEHNLRLTCHACNHDKSDKVTI